MFALVSQLGCFFLTIFLCVSHFVVFVLPSLPSLPWSALYCRCRCRSRRRCRSLASATVLALFSLFWLVTSNNVGQVVLAARVFVIKFAFISLVNSFFFSFLFLFACVCAPSLCVCVYLCVSMVWCALCGCIVSFSQCLV